MVVETTQKCISKEERGGDGDGGWVGVGDEVVAAWCFQHSPPRATMTLLLLGTMTVPGSMGAFGWGTPFMLCVVSLLPAAVWAAH